jgi:hypothetical protein
LNNEWGVPVVRYRLDRLAIRAITNLFQRCYVAFKRTIDQLVSESPELSAILRKQCTVDSFSPGPILGGVLVANRSALTQFLFP